MVEVSLTVGKLDALLALLLTKDHHLIEFPTILLPNGVKAGSIVKIKCDQDLTTEAEESRHFQRIQDEILNTFGKNLPQPPVLKVRNTTQTSCVLEWETLELGTASLKNLILFKDGKKLGAIPLPLANKTTKLSGLPIDKTFQFQLRLDTTAGVYLSDIIEVTTHKMTDLSGITVCLGDISSNDQFNREDIEDTLKNMGANFPAQDRVKVDTTHFICTRENKQNPEFVKANDMNIPIIRPEWLKACERERRIVGVRDFYVKDCVLPDIFAKNYWKNSHASVAAAAAASDSATETASESATGSATATESADSAPVDVDDLPKPETVPVIEVPTTKITPPEDDAPVSVQKVENELPPLPEKDEPEDDADLGEVVVADEGSKEPEDVVEPEQAVVVESAGVPDEEGDLGVSVEPEAELDAEPKAELEEPKVEVGEPEEPKELREEVPIVEEPIQPEADSTAVSTEEPAAVEDATKVAVAEEETPEDDEEDDEEETGTTEQSEPVEAAATPGTNKKKNKKKKNKRK